VYLCDKSNYDNVAMMYTNSAICQMSLWLQLLLLIGTFIVTVNPLVVPPTTTKSYRWMYLASVDIRRQRKLSFTLWNPNQKKHHLTHKFGDSMEMSKLEEPQLKSLCSTRRNWIKMGAKLVTIQQLTMGVSEPALAKSDCYTDCYKNCKLIAPKDDIYCKESCTEYCNQEDRQDGLSGSISSDKGEVGILGGSFGTGTVVKGQDKPPSLGRIPGLDFTSESGKKMIGY
jgi:hypothetical protein